MGCFCRQSVLAMRLGLPGVSAAIALDASLVAELGAPSGPGGLVCAVAAWLSARWLPAPAWQPDPLWLEVDIPALPMPQASLSVVLGLVQARLACQAELGLDLTVSADVARLARIIVTLNLRLPGLQVMLEDGLAWSLLATLNEQADLVINAASQGSFDLAVQATLGAEFSLAPWRPLLIKLKAIAPLLAIGQALNLDLGSPGAAASLAVQLRLLANVTLPAFEEPGLVMALIARFNAIARLQLSLGADPRSVPFAKVQAAVERKLSLALSLLPPSFRLEAGLLVGVPPQLPNPGALLTTDTITLAASVSASLVERLAWTVPGFGQLSVLTTAAPLVRLAAELRECGITAILQAPCDGGCDAGGLRASPGSGTGAAPAR